MKAKILIILLITLFIGACSDESTPTKTYFEPTEKSSQPWVYWYWMQSAYTKEGITADLEAMKEAGIGGAYLMSIKGPTDPPLIHPPILQLSKEWWDLVGFAIQEADRLGLEIAMHAADGFAVAGGPWIKPEQSMQKVVWADTIFTGGSTIECMLPKPDTYEGYYKDIATYAIPLKTKETSSKELTPLVTTSLVGLDASFLSDIHNEGKIKLSEPGYIQYEFKEPFTCKSVEIETAGNNYQAQRLTIEVSNNGTDFKKIHQFTAPRHGWQDTDANHTFSIPVTTAKYFRFVYNPEGSEPGSEDLDAAKWKQSLKIKGIYVSNVPLVDNYEGKNGSVWRVSPETTEVQIPLEDCIAKSDLINISEFLNSDGKLKWNAPEGNWKIIRFGHTSTGHMNATGGAGKGLEVDKFNKEAIKFQFDHWYGKSAQVAGPELTGKVLSVLHLDSWECGSQNWSPVFREEFKKRRGYDLLEYLPVMAGIPVDNITVTEQILHDVRKTISELITDNFYGTLREEADKLGVTFSSENVAPTMVSDALLHFKTVDLPGGEFWLRSPTHDKPNDMLDAISGGHIYGKPIIQAEAFTQLRMDWDEHPGNIKTLADRNYALGINRFFYHVFVHNPWIDRKPGMTLDGVGLYFQRDQTWWKQGKEWINYCKRVQYQLQKGIPVVDIAVFTGEELPSRSVLPDRLVPFIPNMFGKEKLKVEKERVKNEGLPTAKMPAEVTYSKNVTDLSEWVNPLNGYKYDSFNPDALINNAHVVDGKVYFEGDIAYSVLIFPDFRKMSPNNMMSIQVAEKILKLVTEGATIMVGQKPDRIPGLNEDKEQWSQIINKIWEGKQAHKNSWKIGEGLVLELPYMKQDLTEIDILPDVLFPDLERNEVSQFAWNHKETKTEEIYFISNQKEEEKETRMSFRVAGKKPYIYDPVSGESREVSSWIIDKNRTIIPLTFDKNQSVFIIFKEETDLKSYDKGNKKADFTQVEVLDEHWEIHFNADFHGPKNPIQINNLFDWSTSSNDSIKYYSGTAIYTKTFLLNGETSNVWLNLGDIANIATVKVNGIDCGTLWTFPYRIDISKAIQKGENTLEIEVTNTWANRLIGDELLPKEQRLTWTTAPFRLQNRLLLKAGLLGPIILEKQKD
ncbi:glycosyl hydrolase [Neptunitalea lumnitzerae]|uniref:DNA-binding protein n=1 Tax=Neptunitalea lumnitzerae TaxID=2965509 RepID=A0ABQ5MKP5_9FLAO|nr:glycosyl hydrolase [Neptunitalea sp. Y10]GLB49625.1 DNA-binding protein [Neptunitalea sp. Y10]